MTQVEQELHYSRQREKKIMYLVYLLQNQGYPVDDIFEKQVKNIPTLRFNEGQQPSAPNSTTAEANLTDQSNYTFRSGDSFEPICCGPIIKG